MFKAFKLALLILFAVGNSLADDAYQFVDTGSWEQFTWGKFSTKDVILSGPSSVVVKPLDNLNGVGTELYLTLLGKANYISVSDFSAESQIAFLRVTSDTLPEDQQHSFTCEIATYSAAKGVKILDTWQRQRESYESSSNCSVGAIFLSNGSLAYAKRTDTQVFLDLIAGDGSKKEILVRELPKDFSSSYGFESRPIENTNSKVIAFQTFPGAGALGNSVFYTLGAAAVTLGEVNDAVYRGQYSPFKLLDNNDLVSSFGVVGSDGKLKSRFARSFDPTFYSNRQNVYVGDGDSQLINDESTVVLKNGELLPLECATGQVPASVRIKSVIDERVDGSLLVLKEDKDYVESLAMLKATGSPLVNSRCAVITHALSKECSAAYRKNVVRNSYLRKAKQIPTAASCKFSLSIKNSNGESLKGVRANVVLSTGSRVYKRFSTNVNGKGSIMLPMRAFAKNQEMLTVNVFGKEIGLQDLTITINNYTY